MDTRGFLSRRRHQPIKVPARPVIGVPVSSSIQVSSEWLAGGTATAGSVTDLRIENLETRTVEARISFAGSSGALAPPVRLSLSPLEAAELPDVLDEWFATSGAGTLTLEAGDSVSTLALSARSYARGGASATVGAGPGTRRFAAGVSETDAFSSEIDAFNLTSAPELFGVRLRGADGSVVGARETLSIAGGQQAHWTLRELFPEASGDAMTVELFAVSSSSVPVLRASVTDLLTGSRIQFPADLAASRMYLPVDGRTEGSGDTFLATDAIFFNSGSSPLTVRVRFLEGERDNSSAPTATLRIGPGQTLPVLDVLGRLFGTSEVSGFLEAAADRPELIVSGRRTARSEGAAGTAGTAIPVVPWSRFSTTSLLRMGSASPGPASVIRLLNSGTSALPVFIQWIDQPGRVIAETATLVPASGSTSVVAPPEAMTGQAVAVVVDAEQPIFASLGGADRLARNSGNDHPRPRVAR